jgi:hypothetical protein
MQPRLDPSQLELLRGTSVGVLLGVIDRTTGIVRFFRAGHGPGEFAGHLALLQSGLVSDFGSWGFSLTLLNGQITSFYRNSSLNEDLIWQSLPDDIVDIILVESGLSLAPGFQRFPSGQMTLEQSQQLLARSEAAFVDVVEAAAVLTTSAESTYGDLLRCLDHPGLPAEMAAMALMRRTGRGFASPLIRTLSTDRADWLSYLESTGRIKPKSADVDGGGMPAAARKAAS